MKKIIFLVSLILGIIFNSNAQSNFVTATMNGQDYTWTISDDHNPIIDMPADPGDGEPVTNSIHISDSWGGDYTFNIGDWTTCDLIAFIIAIYDLWDRTVITGNPPIHC